MEMSVTDTPFLSRRLPYLFGSDVRKDLPRVGDLDISQNLYGCQSEAARMRAL